MRSFWRTLDRDTLRDVGLVCVADALVGASFGAIAVSGGLAAWVPVVMSLLVFAGGAQFAAVAVVLSGGSPVTAVATGLALNGRLVPFGFAVADVLSPPAHHPPSTDATLSPPARGGRRWTRFTGAHLIMDEAVAFVMRHDDPHRRRAVFWLSGLSLFAVWNVSVVLGALAGQSIGDTDALGLDAAFPAVILALVLPALRDTGTRNAALLGAALAVAVTPFLPAGLPILLALAGVAVALRSPTVREER